MSKEKEEETKGTYTTAADKQADNKEKGHRDAQDQKSRERGLEPSSDDKS